MFERCHVPVAGKAVFSLVFLLAVPALWAQQNSQNVFASQKFALVIGNSNYDGISSLKNPLNDANDIGAALGALGFSVDKVLDGNLEKMETAVLDLRRKLGGSRNTYGFFFYAGHGVQSNGENYLIPVEANNIRSEAQLRDRAVSLQFVLDSLSDAGNELNMIVLDACRDNPFGWARSGSRGLSVVSRAPTGSIVMYATSANSTASDGSNGNGLFTGRLLNNLQDQDLSVFEVFDKTMGDVIDVSNGRQHPELTLRFPGADKAYLGARPQESPSRLAPAYSPAQPAAVPERSATDGFIRIGGGTFTMGSPPGEPGRYNDEGPQRQVTISAFQMGMYELTQKEFMEITGTNPSKIQGDNLPVNGVSWFDAVEYCNARSRKEGLTPAYAISGAGNNRTVAWNREANGYRLPTEAEWEYACRAGTTTPFSTGNSITTNQANYDGNYPYDNNARGDYRGTPTPVGRFLPNPWYLYDMHGNVWEWCWDLHGRYRDEPQTDPLGADSGERRVLRGGSLESGGAGIRSSFRDGSIPASKSDIIGFRIARNAQ